MVTDGVVILMLLWKPKQRGKINYATLQANMKDYLTITVKMIVLIVINYIVIVP